MATTVMGSAARTGAARDRWSSLIRTIKVLGLRTAVRSNRVKDFSQEMLKGFYATRAIIALHNVGFFDAISQHGLVDLPTFAAEKGLDRDVLTTLCDYLYALRILQRKGARYALDARDSVVTALHGPFYSVYAYQDIFHNLEALLKKEKTFGIDVTRDSAFVAKGSGAVGELLVFPMMADVIAHRNYGHVLDLCCGDATFLIDLCARNPRLRAHGIDISTEAIASGKQHVARKGLAGRIDLVAADAFRVDTVARQFVGVDAVTCIYALHEFLTADQARILDLLCRFKSTFPGVPLVICEVMRHSPEELRERPGGVAEIQLWHELSNQQLMSREQWKALFRRANFAHIHEDYLAVARTAIFTVS